jgi:hypothetical protein
MWMGQSWNMQAVFAAAFKERARQQRCSTQRVHQPIQMKSERKDLARLARTKQPVTEMLEGKKGRGKGRTLSSEEDGMEWSEDAEVDVDVGVERGKSEELGGEEGKEAREKEVNEAGGGWER